MNTTENNKLIAEFMGLQERMGCYVAPAMPHIVHQNLYYHKSWEWLMPVVERISDIKGYTTSGTVEFLAEFYYRDSDNADGLIGVEEFYKAVVEFIKWYNENQES